MTDILGYKENNPKVIIISQIITFAIGAVAILIATFMTSVLDLMLLSYSFMVSGLLVPVLGLLFCNKQKPLAALLLILFGGTSTLPLTFFEIQIPLGFDPILIGIIISLFVYLITKK